MDPSTNHLNQIIEMCDQIESLCIAHKAIRHSILISLQEVLVKATNAVKANSTTSSMPPMNGLNSNGPTSNQRRPISSGQNNITTTQNQNQPTKRPPSRLAPLNSHRSITTENNNDYQEGLIENHQPEHLEDNPLLNSLKRGAKLGSVHSSISNANQLEHNSHANLKSMQNGLHESTFNSNSNSNASPAITNSTGKPSKPTEQQEMSSMLSLKLKQVTQCNTNWHQSLCSRHHHSLWWLY